MQDRMAFAVIWFLTLLIIYSWSLQTTIKFIQQINGKNDPSNIRHWDSNSRPLGHETSLITTRLGLLLLMWTYFLKIDKIAENEQKYIDGKIGPLDILLSNHHSQVGHDWLKWEREREIRGKERDPKRNKEIEWWLNRKEKHRYVIEKEKYKAKEIRR